MSHADLVKFSRILAAPIFSNIRETNHGADNEDRHGCRWSREDAVRENHVLTITCDRCQKTGIYYYVHAYTDLEQDLCVRCYNEMREAATSPALVAEAKKYWKATRDYAAQRQTQSYMRSCVTQPTPGTRPVHDPRISRAEVLAAIDADEAEAVEAQAPKRKRVGKKKE